jgi:hypothetical protein
MPHDPTISRYAGLPLYAPSTASPDAAALNARGSWYLGWGGGLGAVNAAALGLLGVSCPMCVVAVPAMLAYGAWCKVSARRR